MKFSEAILLGSVETGQAFGELRTVTPEGIKTCAFGSAMIAADTQDWHVLVKRRPYIIPLGNEQCPVCHLEYHSPLNYVYRYNPLYISMRGHVISYLNDIHHWTRPKIAEWVALWEHTHIEHSNKTTVTRSQEEHRVATT